MPKFGIVVNILRPLSVTDLIEAEKKRGNSSTAFGYRYTTAIIGRSAAFPFRAIDAEQTYS